MAHDQYHDEALWLDESSDKQQRKRNKQRRRTNNNQHKRHHSDGAYFEDNVDEYGDSQWR
ncbi:hypothetical protein FLM48_15220 [Shewanella sp. Scap07]|uniref:hypothetical protein n=1 Tax=Shewanella sp. Scap07 TaxID=2589987 RepID=UPI0015BEC647|nr:hypothetical protein [Shewanella sp. Scap07]QLE86305.1 hypothetical protein FLM48_15220 [Shewanella sp. Scap07]